MNVLRNKFTIICISPAPWDYPVWTNRQHIMKHLSKEHLVIYLYNPVFTRSALKRILITNKFSYYKKVHENLCVLTPPVLPYAEESEKIQKLNIYIGSLFLKQFLTRNNIQKYIAWFYDPESVQYLDHLKPQFTCYDCVDEFSEMPAYRSPKKKERLVKRENMLISKCNIVFTTSQNLYNQKKLLNEATYLVENVGDFTHFQLGDKDDCNVPADFPPGQGPVLIFIGAVDPYKVDFSILEYLSLQKNEWRILLIGKIQDSLDCKYKFPASKNIYYLGHKEYLLLPQYIYHSDVCLIPYCINEYTKGVFPIKLFEYLATGKPVVSTALPSLSKYKSVIKIANTPSSFLYEVEDALNSDSVEKKRERINCAKNNTWEHRANTLIENITREMKDN